jgi:DNA polymerase-1
VDTLVLWHLANRILPALGDQTSAYEIQVGAIPAVMHMKRRGFKINVAAHAELVASLAAERVAACKDFAVVCPDRALPTKPAELQDLLEALLTDEELEGWKRTPVEGELSTRRSELHRAKHYPAIAVIEKLLKIDKLLATFGPTLLARISPVTGRLHADYMVAGTVTGRVSCSNPNLQAIPRDQRFRKLFQPEAGNVLVAADYSGMELRAAAHISGDQAMTRAFEEGQDLHRLTAARMLKKLPEEVTNEERQQAKAAIFGAIYGQGALGLSNAVWENYGIAMSIEAAQLWHKSLEDNYPQFTVWRKKHAKLCERRQCIVIGRDAANGVGRMFPKSRLKKGKSFYTVCCNYPIQGACADAAMLALARLDQTMLEAGIDGGPVAWIHDEIVVEVPVADAEKAAALPKDAMVSGFEEVFPGAPTKGLVEPHIGESWSEAKGK